MAKNSAVDPHLTRLLISSRLDYPDTVMTVQLKCFVVKVHFIEYLNEVLKNIFVIQTHPGFMSSDK